MFLGEVIMNWSLQASNLWTESEVIDTKPVQALNTVVESVNLLVDQLRLPYDPQSLRKDLNRVDLERVWKLINDGVKGLQTLCADYEVRPELNLPEVQSDSDCEPEVNDAGIAVGRKFESLERATEAFERYARACGFTVCKGNSKRDVYQELACSARGRVRVRKSAEGKKRNRGSVKHMCKCHVILRNVDEQWVVTTRNLKHTHPLLTTEEMRKVAKHRYIPEVVRNRALELYRSGETPAKIQYTLEAELKDQCTWTMKDLYNMLYRQRCSKTQT
jgi:hypothetical protein